MLNVSKRSDLEGVIVQFGGQHRVQARRCPLLRWAGHAGGLATGTGCGGTSPESIDQAEDREQFEAILRAGEIRQPRNGLARTLTKPGRLRRPWATPLSCVHTCWAAAPWKSGLR